MSSLEARTGRHRQRYENNYRLVSGCIPYRLTKDDEDESHDMENRIEVLMVSSPNRNDLVFPKGGWENDETVKEAACREALEEAGVKGILGAELGVWVFRSKSKQELCSLEGGCKGYMFALEVTEELETWPEQENRYRKWLKVKDAFELCRYEWMRNALEVFLKIMAENQKEEEFLRIMAEDQKEEKFLRIVAEDQKEEEEFLSVMTANQKQEETADAPTAPASDVADCAVITSNYYMSSPKQSPWYLGPVANYV